MEFSYSTYLYDGLTSNPTYEFTPDGEQEAMNSDPQIVKIQIQNLFSDQAITTFQHNVVSIGYYPTLYRYVSGSWQSSQLDYSSNVSVPSSTTLVFAQLVSNYHQVYMCETEEQLSLIPNYGQQDMIITRVSPVSDTTYDNYSYASGTVDRNIPICFLLSKVRTNGTEPALSYLGLSSANTLIFRMTASGNTLTQGSQGALPINVSILKTGEVIPDINERLIKLMNKVDSLEDQLSVLGDQIASIQTKLDRILSATSTFFVSR